LFCFQMFQGSLRRRGREQEAKQLKKTSKKQAFNK